MKVLDRAEFNKLVDAGEFVSVNVIVDSSKNTIGNIHKPLSDLKIFDCTNFYYSFSKDEVVVLDSLNETTVTVLSWSAAKNKVLSSNVRESINLNGEVTLKIPEPKLNYIANKSFIEDSSGSSRDYISKLGKILGMEISIQEIDKQWLQEITRKLSKVHDEDSCIWEKVELPLLYTLGECFINKYHAKWAFEVVYDDFGVQMSLPYLLHNGKKIKIVQYVHKELIENKISDPNYEIDIVYVYETLDRQLR